MDLAVMWPIPILKSELLHTENAARRPDIHLATHSILEIPND